MMFNRAPKLAEVSQKELTTAASNSRRKSSHQQRSQKLSKELLRHHGLQDVFMLCHSNNAVELANSSHIGHQLFESIAELNKSNFVENVKKDPKQLISSRIALQLHNYVTDKGGGKIYIQLSGCDEWKEVTDQKEGRGFVFRALLSLFGIEDQAIKKSETLPQAPPLPPSSLERHVGGMRSASPESLPPKKRVRFDTLSSAIPQEQHPSRVSSKSFDAAKTLAQLMGEEQGQMEPVKLTRALKSKYPSKTLGFVNSVLASSDTSSTSRCSPQERPAQPTTTAKVDFAGSPKLPSTKISFKPRPFLPGAFFPKPAHQSHSSLSAKGFSERLSSDGITASQLRLNDIIVGDSGVGAMDLPSTGNRKFRSLIESKTETFLKFEKKAMLRMAQVTVSIVHEAGGRFLAIDPNSSMLHEVKKDVAWTKTLRTYKEFVSKHQQLASVRKFNEAIQKQESLERMQFAFPSSRDRVEQMFEEAGARQGELYCKTTLPTAPVFNSARVLAFRAKLRQLSPPHV